jgi:aryl-alcohol dehydrogenase-like predicted oxidoreductase
MGMSGGYGAADHAESIATVRAAIDAGVTYIDTGDFYGMGHNEMLLRDALKGVPRDKVFIAVKFGSMRDPAWKFVGDDVRPAAAKNFLAYSLNRLGTDYIDLYMPARVSPDVPIEDTVGGIAEMVQAGYVRHIGLSEASAASVQRAHKVHPITALQIEYSLMSRGPETDILPALRELGIGLTAYGVLSRGLISATARASRTEGEIRTRMPRFAPENFDRNLALVEALSKVAAGKNASVAQIAFAWALSRGDDVVPLVGARRRDQLSEALAAANLRLSAADIAGIEAAMPADAVAGTRYLPAAMAHLDSEHAH